MNKFVELPLVEPMYQTYHYQGPSTAIIGENPSIRNWYLNNVMILFCNRKFLHGVTTPEISIIGSWWTNNPYIEQRWVDVAFTKDCVNTIIREMLNQGFYVAFMGVDDYYVQGKSWYKERHHNHDGLLCGYNQEDKTYCIYAYDSNWIYKKFWTPQKSFNKGRLVMLKDGITTAFCGLKVKSAQVDFSPDTVCEKLKEYLNSNVVQQPFDGEGDVYGIVVHEYIAEYLSKLMDGSIAYERMDRRVFRIIWEHKVVMLERIEMLERVLKIGKKHSENYAGIVEEANKMRILYATHHMRRRDSVLPIIREKLLVLCANERKILTSLVKSVEKELKKNAVELS